MIIQKDWIPGQARLPGMTQLYSLVDLFQDTSGSLTTFSLMVFSNLYPEDPVDPVIRVLFPFHLSTIFS